ncbi:hypothetical protein SETIT_8G253500v2 [Setaria italica]|uniref:Uncharacterized protein n=1 Tax=Setaria italica TaxID=4555 RepID=A0A368SBJ0_SETIT|nr:hypothetical protein SETIT_8G253500v2 [Setaria italica]
MSSRTVPILEVSRPARVHFPTPGIVPPKGDPSNGVLLGITFNSIRWLRKVIAELGGTTPRVRQDVVGPVRHLHISFQIPIRGAPRVQPKPMVAIDASGEPSTDATDCEMTAVATCL